MENIHELLIKKFNSTAVQVLKSTEIYSTENAKVLEIEAFYRVTNSMMRSYMVLIFFPEINMYFMKSLISLSSFYKAPKEKKINDWVHGNILNKNLIFCSTKSTKSTS